MFIPKFDPLLIADKKGTEVMDSKDVGCEVEPMVMMSTSGGGLEENRGSAPIIPDGLTQTRAPGPLGQFQTRLVKPLVRFLMMPYLRAQRILQLSRTVNVFHMQSIYIARQALHLVITLNDLVDEQEGPDDEQHQGRIDLEDELIELFDAMQEWGGSPENGLEVNYDQGVHKISQQYAQLFRERFYFHNARNLSDDFIYGKLVAYDRKTIEFRRWQGKGGVEPIGIDQNRTTARAETGAGHSSEAYIENVRDSPKSNDIQAPTRPEDSPLHVGERRLSGSTRYKPTNSGEMQPQRTKYHGRGIGVNSGEQIDTFELEDPRPPAQAAISPSRTSRPSGQKNMMIEPKVTSQLEGVQCPNLPIPFEYIPSITASSTPPDAPHVVVLGSQRCGKSSLLEGISGIPLPRDTGTCTRCPIICRMSSTPDTWCCRIALMRKPKVDGNPSAYKERIPFGSDIIDEREVGDRILRAQAAILHPDKEADIFWKAPDLHSMKASLTGTPESAFSSDSILVEIEGPLVKDLSFMDLPGIITNDRDANVEQVKALAKEYVENEASLILLVYTCNDDIKNQDAGALADSCDPEGRRTIVVLTKPDCIGRREGEDWAAKLTNSDNCFCVRQPDRQDLIEGISRQYARQIEEEFFQSERWLRLSNDPSIRGRLGTRNLANYLNTRIFDWKSERVRQMQEDIKSHKGATKAFLSRFPSSIDDPVRFIDELLWAFDKGVHDAVDIQDFQTPELVGDCRRRLEKFVDMLLYHLSPRFCAIPGPRPGERSKLDAEESPANEANTSKHSFPRASIPDIIYLNDIIGRSDICQSSEIPRKDPYEIPKKLMETFVENWREPTECMLEDVFEYVTRALGALVAEHFGSLEVGKRLVQRVVMCHVEARRDDVRKAILTCLKREKTSSQCFGLSELSHHVDVYLEQYLSQFYAERAQPLDSAVSDTSDAIVSVAGIPVLPAVVKAGVNMVVNALKTVYNSTGSMTKEATLRHAPSADEMKAIEVMAQTRAFYDIAVRRYAEGAAHVVFHDFLLDVQDGPKLLQELRKAIGILGSDAYRQCMEFLQPSDATHRNSSELKSRQRLLKESLKELQVLDDRDSTSELLVDLRNETGCGDL